MHHLLSKLRITLLLPQLIFWACFLIWVYHPLDYYSSDSACQKFINWNYQTGNNINFFIDAVMTGMGSHLTKSGTKLSRAGSNLEKSGRKLQHTGESVSQILSRRGNNLSDSLNSYGRIFNHLGWYLGEGLAEFLRGLGHASRVILKGTGQKIGQKLKSGGHFLRDLGYNFRDQCHIFRANCYHAGNKLEEFIMKIISDSIFYKLDIEINGGESSSGTFHNPQDFCYDQWFNLFIADTGNDSIKIYASDGSFITEVSGNFFSPTQIINTSFGVIFIASPDREKLNAPQIMIIPRTQVIYNKNYTISRQSDLKPRIFDFPLEENPAKITDLLEFQAGFITVNSAGELKYHQQSNVQLLKNLIPETDNHSSQFKLAAINSKRILAVTIPQNNLIRLFRLDSMNNLNNLNNIEIHNPISVTLQNSGVLLASSDQRRRFQIYDPFGKKIAEFGTKGYGYFNKWQSIYPGKVHFGNDLSFTFLDSSTGIIRRFIPGWNQSVLVDSYGGHRGHN